MHTHTHMHMPHMKRVRGVVMDCNHLCLLWQEVGVKRKSQEETSNDTQLCNCGVILHSATCVHS